MKGVACETRSEPLPSTASLAVGLTPRTKRTGLLTLLDVRNAISPCLCFFAVQNNNFNCKCTNELEHELAFLAGKGGVRISRVYESLEIL